jgi:hypothetical protein
VIASPNDARTAGVSSVDPSSTTITSSAEAPPGSPSCSSADRTAASTYAP